MSAAGRRLVATLFAAALLILPCRSAMAEGINLFWNDCSLGATAETNREFACDTNEGTHVLVGSVDPPPGLSQLNGMTATIDLTSASCPTPSWWQFVNSGSCRRTALSVLHAPQEAQVACGDLWQGATPIYLVTYLEAFEGIYRRSRIEVSAGLQAPVDSPTAPGTEYYAFSLVIRNTKTVGADACAGCGGFVCIGLTQMRLTQPSGTPGGSPSITAVLNSNYASWQGQSTLHLGCPENKNPYPPCVTPVMDRTWGQIKGIYR